MKFYLILSVIFTYLNADIRTQIIMGTYVSINVDRNHSVAFERMKDIDLALSSYNEDAEIFKLNSKRELYLTPLTIKSLNYAKEIYTLTDGYFNVAIGNITRDLYRFGEDERVATVDELEKASIGWDLVQIDNNYVKLLDSVKLDFGGVGKGIAVDRAASVLDSLKINSGVISASGDIRCLGLCEIDITNPFTEDVFTTFKTLKPNLAISTSGNYRRYVKKKENNHLINPKSKTSEQTFASVTLVSFESNAYVDALSTAIAVMPFNKALSFLKEHNELGYLLIRTDKSLYFDNLDSFVTHNITNEEKNSNYKKSLKNQKAYPLNYRKKRKVSYEKISTSHINYKANK